MNKMYAVFEIGWEYNDSTYDRRDGKPVKLYKTEEAAVLVVHKMSKERKASNKGYEMFDESTYKPITQFYEIIEIEVADV